jgi:hypothetical protein
MRDRDTVIRVPHEMEVTREKGQTKRREIDPRVSVSMQEKGATLILFFDPERALAGDALLEVRISPTEAGVFEPWRLLPALPHYVQYARAAMAHKRGDAAAALDALQRRNSPGRGLDERFLRDVADYYMTLVEGGERYPIKALASLRDVDKSTASRWITAARQRGLLSTSPEKK